MALWIECSAFTANSLSVLSVMTEETCISEEWVALPSGALRAPPGLWGFQGRAVCLALVRHRLGMGLAGGPLFRAVPPHGTAPHAGHRPGVREDQLPEPETVLSHGQLLSIHCTQTDRGNGGH